MTLYKPTAERDFPKLLQISVKTSGARFGFAKLSLHLGWESMGFWRGFELAVARWRGSLSPWLS
jgi:hypothetical protein